MTRALVTGIGGQDGSYLAERLVADGLEVHALVLEADGQPAHCPADVVLHRGDVGDVEAMWRMLQQDEADDYVIATGATHSIRDFLDVAFAHVGIDDWTTHVTQDPRFMRPAEVELLVGDASKAKDKLGWTPTVSFAELVAMMVDSDIAAAKAGW